ncbi:MAG: FMN-binding protein [Lachnospiraceae bacterium]|nr:FMN-binding protein [Lachnospiraceae bacterium]
MGKAVVLGLAFLLLSPGSTRAGEPVSSVYKDGVYYGEGQGRNGSIRLKVTVTDGKIDKIEEESQKETASYWEKAKGMFDSIIEKQTTEVDVVSGATLSCEGIREAVEEALKDAAGNDIFAGGTGTENDPFRIQNEEQLRAFADSVDAGTSYEGQYVKVTENILLTEDEAWNPIGTEDGKSSIFQGSFDGSGKTISGISIQGTYTTEANVGLFSVLGKDAVVKDLKIVNADVAIEGEKVKVKAGILAGSTEKGAQPAGCVVDSVNVRGKVASKAAGALCYAGGMIGYIDQYSLLENCVSEAEVLAESTQTFSAYAGGLVGTAGNNAILVNDISFGSETALSPQNVNFGGMAGGMAAMYPGKMWNTVSLGNATVGNAGTKHVWVGALAGQVTTSGMVKGSNNEYVYPEGGALRKYAYFADDIKLQMNVYSGESVSENSVDLAGTGYSPSVGYDKCFATESVPADQIKTDDMADRLNDNLKDVTRLANAYGLENIALRNWVVKSGKLMPGGDVYELEEPDETIFAGGDGTKENPFLIETEQQLRAFASSVKGSVDYKGYFVKLAADVDVSSAQWTPIGGDEYAFAGTFDGNKKTITGIRMGSEDTPAVIDGDGIRFGLFSNLQGSAVVKDVNLNDFYYNAESNSVLYVGGIVSYMAKSETATEENRIGARIDGCSVSGKIRAKGDKNNCFAAGIAAYQYCGSVTNCKANVDIDLTVKSGNGLAEAGGLVALNNRGLVAGNSYEGSIIGDASRSNGDEGMAVLSLLVAVNAGDESGNFATGSMKAKTYSTYVGTVSGWVTGIGKCYNNYYGKSCSMQVDGRVVSPVESIGTKVTSGVNEEGDAYVGGIVSGNDQYDESKPGDLAVKLNTDFAAFPTDPEKYGFAADNMLYTWKTEEGRIFHEGKYANITYVQPEAEKFREEEPKMADGTWYGRNKEKSVIATITVSENAVAGTVYSDDQAAAEEKEEALKKAVEKATYGDTSDYAAFDGSVFAGGKGTEQEPYLIENERQLRYVAESLNADTDHEGLWFKQTADITLTEGDWLPIGWGIKTKIKNAGTQYCAYPFMGSYDGDGHKILGLSIGTKNTPTADPRCSLAAGLFGAVTGNHRTNEDFAEDEQICRIKNVELVDAVVNVKTQYENYVGALAGCLQNGFEVDNCKVSGFVSSYSADSHARAAGFCGSGLRGVVKNVISDVSVYGGTDAGSVYAGGLYGMDNRVTSVNVLAAGSVEADATTNNKIHAGGLVGQAGGAYYNAVGCGDVTANKTTSDAGLFAGRFAGIVAGKAMYVKKDAKVTAAGEKIDSVVGTDVTKAGFGETVNKVEGSALKAEAFVKELNDNILSVAKANELQTLLEENETGLTHTVLYHGDGSDLKTWEAGDLHPVFKTEKKGQEKKEEPEKSDKPAIKPAQQKTQQQTQKPSQNPGSPAGQAEVQTPAQPQKEPEVYKDKKSGNTYSITSEESAKVEKVKIRKGTAIIPGKVVIKGKAYKVTAVGKDLLKNKKIKTLKITGKKKVIKLTAKMLSGRKKKLKLLVPKKLYGKYKKMLKKQKLQKKVSLKKY